MRDSYPKWYCSWQGWLAAVVACLALLYFKAYPGSSLETFFFAILGFGMIVWGIKNLVLGFHTKHWPTTEGCVHSTGLKQVYKTARFAILPGYEAVVRYEYQVPGVLFHLNAETVSLGQWLLKSKREAQTILDRYLPGKQVRVFYHPRHPQLAVLEPHIFLDNLLVIVIGGFFLLCVFVVHN